MAGINFAEIKEEFIEQGNSVIKRISWLDKDGNVLNTRDVKISKFSLETQEAPEGEAEELVSVLEKFSWIPSVKENVAMIKSGEKKVVPAVTDIFKSFLLYFFKSSWN